MRPWDSPLVVLIKSMLYPLATTASLWLALLLCREPFHRAYFLTAVLAFIAAADVLSVAPLQESSARRTWPHDLIVIARRWLLVVAFLWALITVSGLQSNFQRRVWLAWALVTPFVLWLSRVAVQRAFELAAAANRVRPHEAIIIGCNELGRLLERKLHEDASSGIRVMAYFDDERPDPDGTGMQCRQISELRRFMRSHDARIVYITWPMAREQRILQLLEILQDSTASIYFVPDVSIVDIIQGRLALVSGIPVVGVCESPLYGLRGLQKRIFDVVVSSVLSVMALPLCAMIALGVWLSSPGPVLFKQRRYGLDGREFTVYKFRSMRVTEDGSSSFTAARRGDSRVTAFGAFIRRTSADELPQLLNVLTGSMSLVGPRPHVVAMNESYRRLISGYMRRHKVRPGITGWAQVNGSRGGNNLEDMKRRVELDLEYLKHWSLQLDVVILLRTIALIWSDRRAY